MLSRGGWGQRSGGACGAGGEQQATCFSRINAPKSRLFSQYTVQIYTFITLSQTNWEAFSTRQDFDCMWSTRLHITASGPLLRPFDKQEDGIAASVGPSPAVSISTVGWISQGLCVGDTWYCSELHNYTWTQVSCPDECTSLLMKPR